MLLNCILCLGNHPSSYGGCPLAPHNSTFHAARSFVNSAYPAMMEAAGMELQSNGTQDNLVVSEVVSLDKKLEKDDSQHMHCKDVETKEDSSKLVEVNVRRKRKQRLPCLYEKDDCIGLLEKEEVNHLMSLLKLYYDKKPECPFDWPDEVKEMLSRRQCIEGKLVISPPDSPKLATDGHCLFFHPKYVTDRHPENFIKKCCQKMGLKETPSCLARYWGKRSDAELERYILKNSSDAKKCLAALAYLEVYEEDFEISLELLEATLLMQSNLVDNINAGFPEVLHVPPEENKDGYPEIELLQEARCTPTREMPLECIYGFDVERYLNEDFEEDEDEDKEDSSIV